MNSTRLPGKSLMDLGGITLIESVYHGATASRRIDEIIVAVPNSRLDDQLFEFLIEKKIRVFRGSEDDLISRHLQAAFSVHADFIVRIPGDNPLPHGSEIDRIIGFHLESNRFGFSTNLAQVLDSGYPDGIGAEVFSFQLLDEVYKSNLSKRQREHLHLNFFDYENQSAVNPESYPVGTVRCPKEFAQPEITLDINTRQDFEYFCRMFVDLGTHKPHIQDIISWHDEVGFLLK